MSRALMSDKAVKVMARQLQEGDVVVPTRHSPACNGFRVNGTRRVDNRICAETIAGDVTWTPRQELYIYRYTDL